MFMYVRVFEIGDARTASFWEISSQTICMYASDKEIYRTKEAGTHSLSHSIVVIFKIIKIIRSESTDYRLMVKHLFTA